MTLQDPFTVRDVLERQGCSAAADRIAIVDGGRRMTYRGLLARSNHYAAVLARAGIEKGDRVGVFLRRSIETASALFGAWSAGAVAVILNETLRTQQVAHILAHSEASCVITDDRQLRAVREVPCPVLNVDRLDLLERTSSAAFPIGADLAALIYTSGSTGLPKGVMLSHDNLRSGMEIVSRYLDLTGQDVILSLLPFSFDYGLNQLLTACHAGATLVIQRSLFPPDICRTIQEERVTGVAGVPTLWLQLTGRASPFLKSAYPTLRYITNSGGRLPEQTVRAIRAAHPHTQVYLMYGLTEAFRSTFLPPEEVDRRPASMGRAIPNVEVLVVDDDGRRCAPGEVGELVHRGANISMGYWRDPASTSRVFRPHPFQERRHGRHEVVVYSGDLVTADADGFMYYVGRKDMQMKCRGFRVSPEEIERGVHSSNLVAQVVAFASPRHDGDTDIVVAVVPHDPPRFHPSVLEAFCRREMPEYMQPRAIWPMEDLPLTTSGKPDRPAIQHMYAEHVASARTAAAAARTA